MASLGRKLTVCLRLILLLLPGSKVLGLPADNIENKKLEELEEQFYQFGLRQYPELATHIGEHAHDDLLESFTMETFRARKLECSALLVKSHRIAMSRLPPDRRKDLLILRKSLETVIDGFRWRTYGNLNSISFLGFAIKGPIWVASAKYKSQSDYQKYLTRLKSLPVQVRDRTALMKLAIALNRTSHRVSVEKVPSLMGYESHRSLLWRPFLSRPSDIPQRRWKEMIDEATYLIDSELKLAYDELHNFLLLEYIPSSRRTEGVLSWEGGTEYYTACLKWYVGEAVSPHYIHGLGLSEVRRMKDLINKNVLTRIGFNGSLAEFFDHVMSIPDFFNHSADLLLSKYSGLINNQIHGKLFNLFKRVYVPNVRIVQRSFYGPWGSYGANTFFLNSMESEKRSTLDMMPLALHEVNPGHHFQVAYSSQFPLPKYRERHVFGELYAVPFLMPSHQAYIEGWALYAEYLGEEMGLFSDPYLLFGRYCSEMFRACRMVVDTGIHALGWSRQQAIEYIAAHTMFPPRQIAMEVDRYITWPGQSVAYKMGELKIRQLRKLAERKLGAHFDIKEFHDQILRHGRVPLDILEGIVHDWIKSRSRGRLLDFDQKSDRTPMAATSSSFCDNYYQMCSLTYIVLFSLILS